MCESARPRGGRCACGRDACARPCVPGGPSVGRPGVGVWVWVCAVGWADTRFQMSKHLCVCAHLSRGRAFACTPACPCVPLSPVSKPHVCQRVLVCTWISMRVSTCRAGDVWGCKLEERHPATRPIARPPEAGSVGVAGGGKVPTQAATGAVCVRPGLGSGGSERFSWWPEEPSRAALPLPCPPPPQGQSSLGVTLTHAVCSCPAPSHPPEKRKAAPSSPAWTAGA